MSVDLGIGLGPAHLVAGHQYLDRPVAEQFAHRPVHGRPVSAGDDGHPDSGAVQIPDRFSEQMRVGTGIGEQSVEGEDHRLQMCRPV